MITFLWIPRHSPKEELVLYQVKIRRVPTQTLSQMLWFRMVTNLENQSPTPCLVLCLGVLFIKFSCLGQQNKKKRKQSYIMIYSHYVTVWFPGSYQPLFFQRGTGTPGVILPSHDICSWMECLPTRENAVEVHCSVFLFSQPCLLMTSLLALRYDCISPVA